jgi:hypothetical protein
MPFTYKGSFGPMSVAPQYGGQAGSVAVYTDAPCTILATLFSTRTGTALANPLPVSTNTNDTGHFPGVDVLGNVLFFAAPGWYYLKVNGAAFMIQVVRDWGETGAP